MRWASHCQQVSQLETTWQIEKSWTSPTGTAQNCPFSSTFCFFRKWNLTCNQDLDGPIGFLFILTDCLKNKSPLPSFSIQLINFPSLSPFLSPSLLHNERKEKVILRADHKSFSQVSSFLHTCDLKAQVNQLLGWRSLLILSYFLQGPVSCPRS